MENTITILGNMNIYDLDIGKHNLKDGWVLNISEYWGTYTIEHMSIHSIWATRTTGGCFGYGIWKIQILDSIDTGDFGHYMTLNKGFSVEDCLGIVTEMQELLSKYVVKSYLIGVISK